MTREKFIERILRLIYNEQPSDDSSITTNLVNEWLNDGIGLAAKKNYTDNLQLEGVASVSNSFYTTFSNLTITQADSDLFLVSLPQIPLGIGTAEGVASLQVYDKVVSRAGVQLTTSQSVYQNVIRPIQNKFAYWYEGSKIYIKSGSIITNFKAKVRMISGGTSTDLSSELNVPDDYIPVIVDYMKLLIANKQRPIETANDGVDAPN
jgi:hypothetical protein